MPPWELAARMEDYPLIKAARYLNVTEEALLAQPATWVWWALICAAAESEAKQAVEQRGVADR